jgi:hypothetical protein
MRVNHSRLTPGTDAPIEKLTAWNPASPGDAGPSDNPWLRKGGILENASNQKDQGALCNEEA